MKLIIDIPGDLYRDILSREAEIREKGYVIEGAVLLATPLDDVKEELWEILDNIGRED